MKSTIETGDAPLAHRVAQFCKLIGLGKTKFYELARHGKIKTIVIGGRRLIPGYEAQRLVREGCELRSLQGPTPPREAGPKPAQ